MAVFVLSLPDTVGGFIQLKVMENQFANPSLYIEALVRREMEKALREDHSKTADKAIAQDST